MADQAESPYVRAVEAIYAAAMQPDSWPRALQATADVFDDVGTILIYQRVDGTTGTIVSPAMESAQAVYATGWWKEDVRFLRAIERGYLASLDAITDRHVVSDEEMATLPFYTDFLAGQGLGWFAGTSILPDASVAAAVSVQRSRDKPPFSDRELSVLSAIARHVENALRLNIRLTGLEATNAALSEALASLDVGVFLVDAAGRAVPANAAAERLGGRLKLVGQRLVATSADEHRALQDAIAGAAGWDAPDAVSSTKPVLIRGSTDGSFLVAYVLPVRPHSDNPFVRLLPNARALVLVRPSGPSQPPDPATVRDLLDLTLGEARVAALVATGLAPREAAERLGIAEETARTVLKRVFAKTGVSRQSELAGLITRLVLR
jgi:DNA-binding CsgD family transcriptional regulator/PAS domain-containing protein